jgi:exopolysaccharide biosynthesis WecB/TagA/CpsF family protein
MVAKPSAVVLLPGRAPLDPSELARAIETVDCLGVPVARTGYPAVRQWFFAAARARGRPPSVFFIVNAHTLNLAWNDAAFRAVLGRADLVLNDGVGLELYGRLAGQPFVENLNGTDLLPRLLGDGDEKAPLRVFLYGGVPGRAERAAEAIEARFSGARVVGTLHGYTEEDAVEAINAASPDVLLVAKGNPLQETWIDDNRDRLDVGVACGVGALLDFLGGGATRAPAWMRSLRVEWAYRLAREPRRLSERYLVGNPAFLARTVGYLRLGVLPNGEADAWPLRRDRHR